MAITATVTVQAQLSGDAIVGTPFISIAAPANANAPPPSFAQLVNGSTLLQVPSGFTIGAVMLVPPTTSTNAKTVKGSNGDTGFPSWTNYPVIVPVVAGATFYITSTVSETIKLVWY